MSKQFIHLSMAVFLTAGSLFAESKSQSMLLKKTTPSPNTYEQGFSIEKDQLPPAYGAPSRINVSNGRDWFVNASFIYWYVSQDAMDIASSAKTDGVIEFLPPDSATLVQDFDYAPGFKVGLGMNVGIDDWVVDLQYTRIANHTTVSKKPPKGGPGTSVWLSNWFFGSTPVGFHVPPSLHISSKWHYKINFLDLGLGRPYYLGRHLTISPKFGLRALWIDQSLKISEMLPDLFGVNPIKQPVVSRNHSNSWGLGPRLGIEGNWLFCHGFRAQGNFAASLIMTKFTKVKHSEDTVLLTSYAPVFKSHLNSFGCVRPILEAGLGFGWGMYLNRQKNYIDFAATYDFNILFAQNMMRKLMDQNFSLSGASPGDLSMHGLTIAGRFDF